jgi:hypothetical protein
VSSPMLVPLLYLYVFGGCGLALWLLLRDRLVQPTGQDQPLAVAS